MDEWNPATDPHITANYSVHDLDGKARDKAALQRSFGLPQRRRIPLFAMTARLTHQKGLELIVGDYTLFMLEAQFIFLGTGEAKYEALLKMYEARWPDRVSVHLGFAERLEHRLMAGADVYLMPSLYEPCGLAQLRAERYGAIPLARRVGGLADTIEDGVTGFLFDEYSSEDLLRVARHVMDRYDSPPAWEQMMRNADARDFSWDRSAESLSRRLPPGARCSAGRVSAPARHGLRPRAAQSPALRAQSRPLAARQRLDLRGGDRHLPARCSRRCCGLDQDDVPAPVTIGVTPVLANQLASPVFVDRAGGVFRPAPQGLRRGRGVARVHRRRAT